MKTHTKLQAMPNQGSTLQTKTVSLSKFLFTLILPLTCMALSNGVHATTFYKWKSPEGVTHFSQTPPYAGKNVETIIIHNDGRMGRRGTTDTPSTDSANTTTDATADENTNQPSAKETELQQQLADKEKQIRDANCTALKDNLANLNAGGRVYEMNNKGEKQFLDNRQIELKQQEVRSQIAKTCK